MKINWNELEHAQNTDWKLLHRPLIFGVVAQLYSMSGSYKLKIKQFSFWYCNLHNIIIDFVLWYFPKVLQTPKPIANNNLKIDFDELLEQKKKFRPQWKFKVQFAQ